MGKTLEAFEDYPSCFLCGRNGCGDPLEMHHIFGGPNRKLSEKYGLKVLLCGNRCHRTGKNAAHQCAKTMQTLHEYGQRKWMQENNGTADDFMKVFGKNYLREEKMKKYYITFGLEGQLFEGGWVEVHADTENEAEKKFAEHYGDAAFNNGFLRCAFVYDEEGFNKTCMRKNGNFGAFCYEVIE